ncbi:Phage capsid scaffolding protein (GPO) serine peptidase [Sphingomonas laterariae]|uniref:Phage capsid scaffolding protein (GPO) serine peptidase n=1 Tax=Edaphosphingomonas laterariae TaxID=861865 RepID=A0A239CK61_9SPHN|nr:GPO family capsid scaffolding protein [Sphingomonas laterariae]SNS20071.1 Phage capsid scaffolding protein (GPO) serine peptidase [Sphingomonas laterariae]
MAKSKFFRIAVEGATVDGREITRQWLEEMAASYTPDTYTARINCEHIAGYSPDRPFNAYGSVLSLKTEAVSLKIDGKDQPRLGLFAEIEANDQLVEINKAGQKLFTSCEIHPNFAGTGKAYLVGLAVTDSPASLGTEPLKFAAMSRPNLFTPAEEIELAIEPSAPDPSAGAFAAVKDFFASLTAKPQQQEPPAQPDPKPANDNVALAQLAEGMSRMTAAMETSATATTARVDKLAADLGALKAQLEKTEQPGNFTRPPATGGGGTIQTDC